MCLSCLYILWNAKVVKCRMSIIILFRGAILKCSIAPTTTTTTIYARWLRVNTIPIDGIHLSVAFAQFIISCVIICISLSTQCLAVRYSSMCLPQFDKSLFAKWIAYTGTSARGSISSSDVRITMFQCNCLQATLYAISRLRVLLVAERYMDVVICCI